MLIVAAGCASVPADPGTVPLAFPSPGTTWVTHTLDGRGTATTVTWTVLEDASYEGRRVHRIAGGSDVRLYDTKTGNWVATLRNGEPRWTASPHEGTFLWPLQVGKAWVSRVAIHDRARGVRSNPVVTFWEVEAYEEVKVPAGKFKAFKLHGSPGLNNPSYTTLWYAPALKLVIRKLREGTASADPAIGFVTELVEYRAP